MALSVDFKNERVSLSKEQTYEALNAYLENASFITSEKTRSQWETWERNLKDSPYFEETYQRVLKERTEELKKRNTLMARLDVKLNRLEQHQEQIPEEKKQKKTLKQKAKEAFNCANPYLAAGIAGAVLTTGVLAGTSLWGAINGVDAQFCASVLVKGAVAGGKVLAAGTAVTAARMTLSAAFANKGGKELLEAKEALRNLSALKRAFAIIEEKDRVKTGKISAKEQPQVSAPAAEKQKLSPVMLNRLKAGKAY
ncbi:MAG: hypothetical protein J5787_04260 [Alphaproteobacteria bacterium]|nr:hypothetical protein [Alphaproteobacteria bacterium]